MILEDKDFGGCKPYIDLTPLTLWGPQLKQIVPQNLASVNVYVANGANHTCELCGANSSTQGVMGKKANKFTTEMRFEHNEVTNVATLKRLLHVCIPCSQAIHICQTEIKSAKMPPNRSPLVGAIARLCHFHNLSKTDVEFWKDKELKMWAKRADNSYPKNIDIDIIKDGINRLWK